MKTLLIKSLPLADLFLLPLVYPAAFLMKSIRGAGLYRLPLCKKALLSVGVFPIRDHYYEPLFNERYLAQPLHEDRVLPGINWNVEEQLKILDSFSFEDELKDISRIKTNDLVFYFGNRAFEAGDAEYWYNLLRLKKPSKIIEIGSGYSTLMAARAVRKNKEENPEYECNHICIEPYEQPWLEKLGISIIRERVESVSKNIFAELGENDILFIDSSHMIRPQGDVLFEYLELLPSLKTGVIVHIHDIFSPKDYPRKWIVDEVRFWNEQYLLEAFLSSNHNWKIIGSLNYLHHNHYDKLLMKCPFLTPNNQPGSFYIQKVA